MKRKPRSDSSSAFEFRVDVLDYGCVSVMVSGVSGDSLKEKPRAMAGLDRDGAVDRVTLGIMTRPKVELLTFPGCPWADTARRSLEEALAKSGMDQYDEINILSPHTSENMRGWGSPAILIDGEDVAGNRKGNNVSCRVYPDGAPSPESIAKRIAQAGMK